MTMNNVLAKRITTVSNVMFTFSDCGNGQNNFSVGVTWTQCYSPERFGGSISTRYSPDWLKFGKY